MKKPVYQYLSCWETGIVIYECKATKINPVTPSKDYELEILNGFRYLGEQKPNTLERITENGRIHNKEMILILYPEDIAIVKVGMRVKFNSTKLRAKEAFNPNLKPYIYDINKKDIVELEIKEIKNHGLVCNQPHIEAILVKY